MSKEPVERDYEYWAVLQQAYGGGTRYVQEVLAKDFACYGPHEMLNGHMRCLCEHAVEWESDA